MSTRPFSKIYKSNFSSSRGFYPYHKSPQKYREPNPPQFNLIGDSPTVKGLFYLLVAGIIIILGSILTFTNLCGLLGIIGYVIALIGFWKIYTDRKYYHEPHPTDMKYSLVFYIFGIIIGIVGILLAIISIFNFSSKALSEGATSGDFESLFITIIISGIILAIGSVLWLLGRYKLLIGLLPVNREIFLKIAFVLAIIVMISGITALGFVYATSRDSFENFHIEIDEEEDQQDKINKIEHEITKFEKKTQIIDLVNTVISIISEFLFLLCFFFAFDYQKKNRQLRIEGPSYRPINPPTIRKK